VWGTLTFKWSAIAVGWFVWLCIASVWLYSCCQYCGREQPLPASADDLQPLQPQPQPQPATPVSIHIPPPTPPLTLATTAQYRPIDSAAVSNGGGGAAVRAPVRPAPSSAAALLLAEDEFVIPPPITLSSASATVSASKPARAVGPQDRLLSHDYSRYT
jgi:hypothetical protein